ncbi:MAG: hypothetical protein K8I29_10080 [Alphaproteobacteria bacterium]|uniref:Uncharacterized protein n=1 Tax=Candidatus Nitrobium versatile TaxID=2884831 RepID=A0A953JBI5_9BACT|nr:hypothetical protein [Candidatus Nitrobium versatile]
MGDLMKELTDIVIRTYDPKVLRERMRSAGIVLSKDEEGIWLSRNGDRIKVEESNALYQLLQLMLSSEEKHGRGTR